MLVFKISDIQVQTRFRFGMANLIHIHLKLKIPPTPDESLNVKKPSLNQQNKI